MQIHISLAHNVLVVNSSVLAEYAKVSAIKYANTPESEKKLQRQVREITYYFKNENFTLATSQGLKQNISDATGVSVKSYQENY